jgi:hypothetical protein
MKIQGYIIDTSDRDDSRSLDTLRLLSRL